MNLATFLKKFNNSKLCYSLDAIRNSRMVTADLNTVINQNLGGADAYFYVNPGGTKQTDITHIRGCFLDIGVGRDKNKKYLSTVKVSSLKRRILKKVHSFKLRPTFLVETRNGYHAYWLFDKNIPNTSVNRALWNTLQSKLYNYFADVGADSKALKINQIMRLPFTMWHKKHEGIKTPFAIKIIENTNLTYSVKKLQSVLTDVSSTKVVSKIDSSFNNKLKQTENTVSQNGVSSNIVLETVEFLNEVSFLLKYSNRKFLASQATRISNELMNSLREEK
jgi:hypothetical protein